MIEFYIDQRAVELTPECSVTLSASLEQVTNPSSIREKRFRMRIPMTQQNRKVMGFCEQMLSPQQFNRQKHSGKIECGGSLLIQGDIELIRCEDTRSGKTCYVIDLIVPPPEWITEARQKALKETALEYLETFSPALIQESWTSDSPVRFLPVKRDKHTAYGQEQVVLSDLSVENYHPFVQVKALLDAIIGESGYRIESQFLNEPFFQSLYMSGNYPTSGDGSTLFRMNFEAERTSGSQPTTADSEGKVYATTLKTNHSVGNLVDKAMAYTGSPLDLAAQYYGKSFRMIEGRPAFVPEQDIIAGFEFDLKYRFAVDIRTEKWFSGVSKISWNEETIYESDVPNTLTDIKNTGASGVNSLWIVAFKHGANTKRITLYNAKGNAIQIFYTYTAAAQVRANMTFAYARYEYLDQNQYVPFEEWAIYSHTEYQQLGMVDSQITVKTLPVLRKKGIPVYFDSLEFEGMAANSSFTLEYAKVKPSFYSIPSNGSEIVLASIFEHEQTQLEFIQAVCHLFGLHLYTDEWTKTVYIEPRFTFLNHTHEVDWSDKIDTSSPIFLEEPGSDRYQTETYSYKSGDATVDRWQDSNLTVFGKWDAYVENRFARAGRTEIKNPLFTATIDQKNSLTTAEDASLIVVGNRNAKDGNLNFPAKIVRYLGIKDLPGAQRWGWPSYGQSYPLVMFHSAGEDWFTLRFDDQDGQLGLRNYYQLLYNFMNNGKKLTLNLRLSPSDMEAILYPNSANRDFRGNFRFTIRGETIRARLLEVNGYSPDNGETTSCVFAVEL